MPKGLIQRTFHLLGIDYSRNSQHGLEIRLGRTRTATDFELAWRRNSPLGTFLGLRNHGVRTIIDVGANDGGFAKLALHNAFPDAIYHSFEPLPGPFAALDQWANSIGPQIQAHNVALGDCAGEIAMVHRLDNVHSSSMLASAPLLRKQIKSREEIITVRMETLDGFIDSHKLELTPEILLKADIQGYEDRVLAGAPETLRKAKAVLLEVNFDPYYEGQPTFEKLNEMLNHFGYRFAGNLVQYYAADGHVSLADALWMR